VLILCYGITKSGSTLAFELAKAILDGAGRPQDRLADGVVEPGHHINFINKIDQARIDALLGAIPEGSAIAVKTHASFAPGMIRYLDRLTEEGRLKVHAAYRDPREICLSMVDAGEHARANERKAFSEIATLDDAAENVKRQISNFLRWAAVKDALRLSYNATAFDMEATVTAMAAHLGVQTDAAAVCQTVTETSFTQKNKAVKDRYKDELTVRQNEHLKAMFRAFIVNACERMNDDWFERRRSRLLAAAPEE
jgi:hypothetical protein